MYTLNLPARVIGDAYCSAASQTLAEAPPAHDYAVDIRYLANNSAN